MPYADREVRNRAANGDPEFVLPRDQESELLVGVLPHPFCNPKLNGCGFCTFTHETFSVLKSTAVARAVVQKIDNRLSRQPDLQNASVAGLYFGGGTANLTPPQPFRVLARRVSTICAFA
jgi:oxygen-independent coproporphyrinogen-3 oxidase